MKQLVIISLLLIALSCQKDPKEIPVSNASFMVFDAQLKAEPVVAASGFYFAGNQNNIDYLLHLSPDGELLPILPLAELLPAAQTLDSVENLSLRYKELENTVYLSYTYPTVQKNTISEQSFYLHAMNLNTNTSANTIIDLSAVAGNLSFATYNLLTDNTIAIFKSSELNNFMATTTVSVAMDVYDLSGNLQAAKHKNWPLAEKMLTKIFATESGGAAAISLNINASVPGSENPITVSNTYFNILSANGDIVRTELALATNSILIAQQQNGKYLIIGEELAQNSGARNYDLLYLSSEGVTTSQSQFSIASPSVMLHSLVSDAGIFISAANYSMRQKDAFKFETAENSDSRLIRTDTQGNLLWQKDLTTAFPSATYASQLQADGSVVWIGAMRSYGVYNNVYLLHTDADGNVVEHEE